MEHSIPELSAAELIAAMARCLVDKPEEVSVIATSNEASTVLRLRVDPTDVGKVIGNQGRMARSLRTLLGAISVKLKHRYFLEIVEDADSHPASSK